MLEVQNTPNSSSSNHLKNDTLFYLGSLTHKCILLSGKCSRQFGHTSLVSASSSLLFGGKTGSTLWMASLGRFEAPTGDIQERNGKMIGPERPSWKAEVSLVLTNSGHWCRRKHNVISLSTSYISSTLVFFYSKFILLAPGSPMQISHVTVSNSVVNLELGWGWVSLVKMQISGKQCKEGKSSEVRWQEMSSINNDISLLLRFIETCRKRGLEFCLVPPEELTPC